MYSKLACNAQCLAYNPDSMTSSPTLDSLSLFLPANELTFLIGSSSSGKSTVIGGDKEQRLSLSHCRLLRHTNRGAEVTRSFNHTETPHLQTFFWRLSHANPAIRGIDTTSNHRPSRALLHNETPFYTLDEGS